MASAAERKAAQRARQRKAGLRKLEVWAHPDDHPAIRLLVEKLAKWRKRK